METITTLLVASIPASFVLIGVILSNRLSKRSADRAEEQAKNARQDEQKTKTETRLDELEEAVQILRRREVWHEAGYSALETVLRQHGIPVPERSAPPSVYPASP